MEKLKSTEGYQILVALAETYFKNPELIVEPLKGDGSDRGIFRISSQADPLNTVVGVAHSNVSENGDFFKITAAFQEAGLSVPDILVVSAKENAYLMQDLGSSTMAEMVTEWNAQNRTQKVLNAYQCVLDCLVRIQRDLPPILVDFLHHRQMNISVYKADLDYFKGDFIDRFGFDFTLTPSVIIELQSILHDYLSRLGNDSFVYRDFQARNIMWLDDKPWFIDYQSAFLGPCHYDMASLLYGSKSGLGDGERDFLVKYYYSLTQPDSPSGFEEFQRLFLLFVVLRRLRSLGTYGFLAGSKDKMDFFRNITPTLHELTGLFRSQPLLRPFIHLSKMIEALKIAWTSNEDGFQSRLKDTYERKEVVW